MNEASRKEEGDIYIADSIQTYNITLSENKAINHTFCYIPHLIFIHLLIIRLGATQFIALT